MAKGGSEKKERKVSRDGELPKSSAQGREREKVSMQKEREGFV